MVGKLPRFRIEPASIPEFGGEDFHIQPASISEFGGERAKIKPRYLAPSTSSSAQNECSEALGTDKGGLEPDGREERAPLHYQWRTAAESRSPDEDGLDMQHAPCSRRHQMDSSLKKREREDGTGVRKMAQPEIANREIEPPVHSQYACHRRASSTSVIDERRRPSSSVAGHLQQGCATPSINPRGGRRRASSMSVAGHLRRASQAIFNKGRRPCRPAPSKRATAIASAIPPLRSQWLSASDKDE